MFYMLLKIVTEPAMFWGKLPKQRKFQGKTIKLFRGQTLFKKYNRKVPHLGCEIQFLLVICICVFIYLVWLVYYVLNYFDHV